LEKSIYPCAYKGTRNINDIIVDIYTFKCEFNHTYIVEVEKHKNNLYLLEYYLKSHSDSTDKYSLPIPLESKKDKMGSKNFLIILNTMQDLMFSYLSRNPKACFAYVGAKTIAYNKEKVPLTKKIEQENADGTFSNTQRYRIYKIYLRRSFSTNKFTHIDIETLSSYILFNNNNSGLEMEEITDYLIGHILN